MLNLARIREFFPQYNQLTDYELTRAAHAKEAPGMPYEQFAQGFGGPLQEDKAAIAARDYNSANPGASISAGDIRAKDRSGFFGGIQLLGEGIYDAVTDQFPEDMARAWRGGDIDPTNPGFADSIIKQQTRDTLARVPSLQEVEGGTLANSLYQGPRSVATSVATGLAGSAVGGAAGSVAGPVGAAAGGMVGGATMSGAAFYRMAKDQFVDEMQQAMQRSMGRTMTSAEAAELNQAIDADATQYGLWEAGPEAISQFFTLGLIKGAGGAVLKKLGMGAMSEAVGKRALTRIPAKMAAEVGEEEVTEGITFMGQESIRQQYGLRPDAPTVDEFIKEQAGPVAVGSLLQLGGMRTAHAIGERMRRRAEDTTGTGETPPADTPSSSDMDPLALPVGGQLAPPEAPIHMGSDQTGLSSMPMNGRPEDAKGEFLSEADMADIDAFVREYEAREQVQNDVAMLVESGRPAGRSTTQLALDRGDTVDLLALPGVAQGIGGLALPPGTGAMPSIVFEFSAKKCSSPGNRGHAHGHAEHWSRSDCTAH